MMVNNFKMKFLRNKIQILKKTRSEKNLERDIIISSAKNASSSAIRTSKALGLSIKSISKGKIVETLPDGSITEIREIIKVKPIREGIQKGKPICLK